MLKDSSLLVKKRLKVNKCNGLIRITGITINMETGETIIIIILLIETITIITIRVSMEQSQSIIRKWMIALIINRSMLRRGSYLELISTFEEVCHNFINQFI